MIRTNEIRCFFRIFKHLRRLDGGYIIAGYTYSCGAGEIVSPVLKGLGANNGLRLLDDVDVDINLGYLKKTDNFLS